MTHLQYRREVGGLGAFQVFKSWKHKAADGTVFEIWCFKHRSGGSFSHYKLTVYEDGGDTFWGEYKSLHAAIAAMEELL